IPVVYEPDPNQPPAPPSAGTPATPEQVLQTVVVRIPRVFLHRSDERHDAEGQAVTAWQIARRTAPSVRWQGRGRVGVDRDHDDLSLGEADRRGDAVRRKHNFNTLFDVHNPEGRNGQGEFNWSLSMPLLTARARRVDTLLQQEDRLEVITGQAPD